MKFRMLFLGMIMLIISSCSNKTDSSNTTLFNDLTFELKGDDEERKPNEFDLSFYKEIQTEIGLEIPLFKVVKNENYRIFIGIPYGMTAKEIITKISPEDNEASMSLHEKGFEEFHHEWTKIDKSFTSFLYSSKGSTVYFLMEQSTPVDDASFVTPEDLSKRIAYSTKK